MMFQKIRPRSKKRAAQEREYAQLRKDFLSGNPICQVKGCGMPADDVHHRAGRIGAKLTDVSLFLAVCRSHHNYIENHPEESKEKGYSLSRLI